MSHTFLTCAGRVAAQRTSDSIKTAEIAWTRVHAIIKSGTCLICNLSDGDRKAYLMPHGDTRDVIFIQVKTAQSRSDGHSEAWFYSLHGEAWSVRFPSDGGEDSWKNHTIVVRSNGDRGAIEPQSWILCRGIDSMIVKRCLIEDRQHDRRTIGPRLRHDWVSFWSKIVAHSRPIQKLRCHQVKPPPRHLKSAPWTTSIAHDFGLIFSLKTNVFLSSSKTFHRLVK